MIRSICINVIGIAAPSGAAVVGFLGILNPILTAVSLLIGIAIGCYVLLGKIKKNNI